MHDGIGLERIRIVLSHTSHPGNIGAAARAMRTMGLSHLYLVKPKHFPHVDARAFAAGALDMLNSAIVCESLDEALAGTILAVAATARNRDLSHEVVGCRKACLRLVSETRWGDVALVFGTERSGLTVAEVNKCGLIATIPASAAYMSLNLAQAVQVFAYEIRIAADAREDDIAEDPVNLATHEEVEYFYASGTYAVSNRVPRPRATRAVDAAHAPALCSQPTREGGGQYPPRNSQRNAGQSSVELPLFEKRYWGI